MSAPKRKVFAYITHRGRLLVFRQLAPEAGIQTPAGTVGDDESLDDAVLREAVEETGLADLQLVRFLGEQVRDMRDVGREEINHRFFYHLRYTGDPPDAWEHWEMDRSDGGPPVPFALFWAPLPDDVPVLTTDHGIMLPRLIAALIDDGELPR